MASRRLSAVFEISNRFDAASLVSSLKKAGWRVRRRPLASVSGAIVDAPSRDVLNAGLVPLFEKNGRRGTLELWLFPQKSDRSSLVYSRSSTRLNLLGTLRDKTKITLPKGVGELARFDRQALPFDVASQAGELTVSLENLKPAAPQAAPWTTLRIDVVRGDSDTLALVAALARLQAGVGSEVAPGPRGILDAFGIETGPPAVRPPVCRKGDPVGKAVVSILEFNFEVFLAQIPGARVGLDVEYVHNMRVAIRRMRAALRMFSKAFIKEPRARLNAELRWMANVLGGVRDLDVYIESVPQYLSYIDGDVDDYAPFIDQLETRRRAAREALFSALDGWRFGEFKSRVETFIASPPLSLVEMALEDVAAAGLGSFAANVLKGASKVKTEEDLHALRIAFKRLRYAVEFLGGVSPKRMARVSKIASRYQDILGRFNDAVWACQRVRQAVCEKRRPALQVFLLGYLLACQRLAAIDARVEFLRRWKGKGSKRLAQAVKAALAKL